MNNPETARTHGNTRHGKSYSRVYSIWRGMMKRCDYPKSVSFYLYGGRGISVCGRWRDFSSFSADMGDPPSSIHTLDRVDSNGNYEPLNCRWATHKEQQRNRSNNRHIEIDGVTKTLSEWTEVSPIKSPGILRRLNTQQYCNKCAVFLPKHYQQVGCCVHTKNLGVD